MCEKFFSYSQKIGTLESFIFLFFFSAEKLTRLFSLKEDIKPFPDRKMIKSLTFENFFRHYDIPAKTRSRMTTAIMNEAGSRTRTT